MYDISRTMIPRSEWDSFTIEGDLWEQTKFNDLTRQHSNCMNCSLVYTSRCECVQWHKPIHRPSSYTAQVFVVNSPHSEDLSNNSKDYRQVQRDDLSCERQTVLFCFTVWTDVQSQWTLQRDIGGDLTISTQMLTTGSRRLQECLLTGVLISP